eukprot:860100-Pleurochrysis_carterae.AAC.1
MDSLKKEAREWRTGKKQTKKTRTERKGKEERRKAKAREREREHRQERKGESARKRAPARLFGRPSGPWLPLASLLHVTAVGKLH